MGGEREGGREREKQRNRALVKVQIQLKVLLVKECILKDEMQNKPVVTLPKCIIINE